MKTEMSTDNPETVREVTFMLKGEIEKLRISVDSLSATFKYWEEKKIAVMEKEIQDLKSWKQQVNGGWKVAAAIWFVVSGFFFVWFRSKFNQ